MRLRDYIRELELTDSGPLGDMARAVAEDPDFPDACYSEMRRYLEGRAAPDGLLDALDTACDRWEREYGAHGLASGARVWWGSK